MIKVFHLITSLDTGGAEVTLRRLLSRFNRGKFENVVASLTNDGPIGAQIRELDIPVHIIGMRRGVPSLPKLWSLWRLICRERPSILQTWLYHSDLIGLLLGRAARVGSIVWNIRCADTGEMYSQGLRGLTFRILVRLSSWADTIIANSHAGQEHHQSCGYSSQCWKVIPNGYDTKQLRPRSDARPWLLGEANLDPENIIIGIVARYDALKGHEIFLQAASILAERREMVRFVMVGSGIDDSNAELLALIRKHGVGNHVRLLGERADIPRITAGFDIATCTSHSEGFPNMVAEAMACGVPCVATNVGDVDVLLGGIGWIVPVGDPVAMAAGWEEVVNLKPQSKRQVGEQSRRRIIEKYSLDAVTQRYEKIYSALAKASALRPA